jgi:SEC-C motif domain protein
MRRPNPLPTRCPCGRAAPYADCCGRFLDGGECPDTAEALMRSRYVAQVRDRMDHLHRTWHPSTRPASLDRAGEPVRWLGLNVLRVEAGGTGDARGTVVFVARYKIGGRAYRLRESSRFVREDGRWFYLDADGTP